MVHFCRTLSPNRRRGLRKRAFTLVEILVTMAIIALLAALAIPAYNSAIKQAKKAVCSANLRSIGVGMLSYAADNNQFLPESGVIIPYGSKDQPPPAGSGNYSWTQQLDPYIGGCSTNAANPVFTCPESSKTVSGNSMYSYFNGCHAAEAATGGFGPVNMMRIRNRSAFIMAGDCSFGGFTTVDADKDDYTQDPAFNGGTPTTHVTIPIHNGISNILFADGHVEGLKYFDPTVNTTVYQGPGAQYTYLWKPGP